MKNVLLLSCVACTLAGAAALADDSPKVRTTATVEVIDDTTQVDEVISRLKAPETTKDQKTTDTHIDLKSERPPLTTEGPSKEKPAQGQRDTRTWRPNEERILDSERTEKARERLPKPK